MRLARPCQRCGEPFRLHTRADTRQLCGPCLVKARHEWRLDRGRQASDDNSDATAAYIPTEEEIRSACLEIQAAWKPDDFVRRAGAGRALPVDVMETDSRVYAEE